MISVLIHPRDLQFILFGNCWTLKNCVSRTATRIVTRPCLKQPLRRRHRIALDQFEPLAKICDEAEPCLEEVARFCRMVLKRHEFMR